MILIPSFGYEDFTDLRTLFDKTSFPSYHIITEPLGGAGVTMSDARAQLDNLAWDKNDEASEISQKRLRRRDICELAACLAERNFGGESNTQATSTHRWIQHLYRIQLEGMSSDAYVRLPCPDWAQLPIEKTLREGATERYVE